MESVWTDQVIPEIVISLARSSALESLVGERRIQHIRI